MHGAIRGLCAGTPVMPLADECKTAELFGRLGFAGKVPSIEGIDGATLCAAFRQALLHWQVCGEEIWSKVAAEEKAALSAAEHVPAALGLAPPGAAPMGATGRSAELRVGTQCVSPCRPRCWPYQKNTKPQNK